MRANFAAEDLASDAEPRGVTPRSARETDRVSKTVSKTEYPDNLSDRTDSDEGFDAARFERRAARDIRHRQTVPRSPKISALGSAGAKAEQRRKKLIAEKEAREKEACTFRPKTNERPRKELIEKLLAEDDY